MSDRIVQASAKTRNALLSALPADDLAHLWPQFEPVTMRTHVVWLKQGSIVDSVLFPEAGVVSMISTLEDGARIEVGMVGFEGMVGLPLLLGSKTSGIEGLIQVGGRGLRLSASAFRAALSDMPSLLPLLLRYVDAYSYQVAQSAACNGRHAIEQRLARWLLMTHDRVGEDSFTMTQEFMSTMLGVRRPGVTLAIGVLQRAGIVQHAKGVLSVRNRAGLEAASCECYRAVVRRFREVMPSPG